MEQEQEQRAIRRKNIATHTLYKTKDADAPAQIKDRNGEVALDLCRICGRGEIELYEPCWMPITKDDQS